MNVAFLDLHVSSGLGGRLKVWPLFLISVALMIWTATRLLPIAREARLEAQGLTQQAREVEALQHHLALSMEGDVEMAYAAAVGSLADGDAGVRGWLNRVTELAEKNGFRMELKFSDPEVWRDSDPRIERVVAEVQLQPRNPKAGSSGASFRWVELLSELDDLDEWVEVVGFELNGKGQGLSSAKLALRIWVEVPSA